MRYGSVKIRTVGARARYATWAAYAACAWAFAFAALSFYWAAGGTAGAETIGEAVTKPVLAREPGWIALLWATGALKALGGLLALALVQPWGRVIPRWMRLTAAWGAGALMFLYGGASMVQFSLMSAGVLSVPASVGTTAVRWHLLLWEPWWMLGGLLFMAAAWLAGRRGA
jgi:Protein of unknown function (DUF3995)